MLDITIGPYRVYKRTEYSKTILFDVNTNEDITNDFPGIAEKIVNDYEKQIRDPDLFFEIENDKLLKFIKKDHDVKYIFLPNNIKSIENRAFIEAKIKEIKFPNSLLAIDNAAFYKCCKLEHLYLPNNLGFIGAQAFLDCNSLKYVKFSNKLQNIGTQAFRNCVNLNSITFPDSLLYIASGSFSDCTALKSIAFSDKIKSIGDNAFSGCVSLKRVDLSGCIPRIGSQVFSKCISLKEAIMPKTVTEYGYSIFDFCIALERVKLPRNLSFFSKNMFVNCSSLKKIEVPESIHSFDAGAFNSSGVKTLVINHDIKKVKYKTVPFPTKKGVVGTNLGITYYSNIDTIIIGKNVRTIDPNFFGYTGMQIKNIKYLGTKEEFRMFAKNNRKLALALPSINEIKFMDSEKSYCMEDFNR